MNLPLGIFPIDRCPESRLAAGLAVSVLLHAAVAMGVAPNMPTSVTSPSPATLTVTLLPAEPKPAAARVERRHAEMSRAAPAGANPGPLESDGRNTQAASASPHLVSLALPPGPHYFSAKEIDTPAEAINDVLLRYPPEAYEKGVSGEVKLRIWINERGEVDKLEIVDSKPTDVFDAAAIEAAKQLRYSPAIKDGTPVKSFKTAVISFDPTTEPLR